MHHACLERFSPGIKKIATLLSVTFGFHYKTHLLRHYTTVVLWNLLTVIDIGIADDVTKNYDKIMRVCIEEGLNEEGGHFSLYNLQ